MLDGLRILLVEDDDIDRMRVHRAVKRAGSPFELVDAHDVATAKDKLAAGDFDVAVIDYNLPDGTAMDLLAYNGELSTGPVPMVVLTGSDDDEKAIAALKEGAEDYLVKATFEVDAFFRSIRYAIERATLRGELKSTNSRLARELEIGGSIQTAILPREIAVAGLDITASMAPATEVGGDYYDVLPTQDGCWLGIGDVAGHGMGAAIVALMTQSALASMTRLSPSSGPAALVSHLNEVLFENIRNRLAQDEHVTLTLLRYTQDGLVRFAGAHEEMVVHRAATQQIENIPTPGTWLGARRDIEAVTSDGEIALEVGDTLLLYSDGVTEARNADGETYGLERPSEILRAHADESSAAIHARIWADIEEWTHVRDDDVTLIVVRRLPAT